MRKERIYERRKKERLNSLTKHSFMLLVESSWIDDG
jgi:hypothetical protein